MLFQVLCGFEPIFYTTHPNEEPIKVIKKMKQTDNFKFAELAQKSSKELFFLFYHSIIMV